MLRLKCKRGHYFTEDNTKWFKGPKGILIRKCRQCQNMRERKRRTPQQKFDFCRPAPPAARSTPAAQAELRKEPMNDKTVKIGRLAMRREGKFWNAYYALPDSMKDAILLGSIAIRFVPTQDRKDAFINMMRDAVSDIIEEKIGKRPSWPDGPQPAPESERAGHG